jgi:hypothetical protein
MKLINDVYKHRMLDKNFKDRYKFNKSVFKIKYHYFIDNITYLLYEESNKLILINLRYYKKDKLHRDDDKFGNLQPAQIYRHTLANITGFYYKEGIFIKFKHML